MDVGVDTDRIHQLLYRSERAERIALQTRGLHSLQLMDEGRVAVMQVARGDFIDTKSSVNDTEDLINIPLQIRSVEVAALIVESPDGGPIRVSLRSKGKVDVAKFAEQFGGGGHARAAGLKLATSLMDVRQKVIAALMALKIAIENGIRRPWGHRRTPIREIDLVFYNRCSSVPHRWVKAGFACLACSQIAEALCERRCC